MKKLFLFCFIVPALIACNKEEEKIQNTTYLFDAQVGDVFKYQYFDGTNYFGQNASIEYYLDTLHIEILTRSESSGTLELQVEEYLSKGSAGRSDSTHLNWFSPSYIANYTLLFRGDSLIVKDVYNPPSSKISWQDFSLDKDEQNLIEFNSWSTTANSNLEAKGHVRNYSVLGKIYEHANVYINNTPTAVDGPGVTFIYNEKNGLIRFSTFSPWTNTGYGWDLIPD